MAKETWMKFKNYLSVQLIITSAVLAATFFLLFIANLKTYTSTVTILVTAKSEIAAAQQAQIVANIVEIPHTLAFYDRMLRFNPDITDKTAGNNLDKRKQLWNESLNIEKVDGNSSLIKISISDPSVNDADKLATKTTRTLLDVASMYYNVKDDIDLRIIDGPISKASIPGWPIYLILSILMGSAIAFILQIAFMKVEKLFSERKKQEKITETKKEEQPTEQKQENQPQKKDLPEIGKMDEYEKQAEQSDQPNAYEIKKEDQEEREFLNKIVDQNTYPNYPEMPVHEKTSKAQAPDNLPIGDDSFFQDQYVNRQEKDEMMLEEKEESVSSFEEVDKKRENEPSPEQYKERLNKLLRGE